MNYRFVNLSSVYSFVASKIESDLPRNRELSYAELLSRFIDVHFGEAGAYDREMNALGNPSVLILPEPLLLKAWARENGISYENDPRQALSIVLRQIAAYQPDVVLLSNLYYCDYAFRQELRQLLKGNALVIAWRSAPTDDFSAFADLDLMLTGSPLFAEHFRSAGVEAEYLPLAFDPSILDDVANLPQDLEFTFAGTIGDKIGYHSERFRTISALMKYTPLQIWGDISIPHISRRMQTAIDFSAVLERIGVSSQMRRHLPVLHHAEKWRQDVEESAATLKKNYSSRIHPAIFGLEYFRVLCRSQISFNNHINVAGAHGGNMRLFEATGVGSCLLTDWKENLSDFFIPDVEVVTYRSSQEATEKVKFLLEHPEQRRAIALAGQRRTLSEHTYKQRAQQLDALIQSLIKHV